MNIKGSPPGENAKRGRLRNGMAVDDHWTMLDSIVLAQRRLCRLTATVLDVAVYSSAVAKGTGTWARNTAI